MGKKNASRQAIFSLDYDGCSVRLTAFKDKSERWTQGDETLHHFLQQLSAASGDKAEVLCGSARQSRRIDMNLVKGRKGRVDIEAEELNSGLNDIKRYAETFFRFNPFLLRDEVLGKPPGYAFLEDLACPSPLFEREDEGDFDEWSSSDEVTSGPSGYAFLEDFEYPSIPFELDYNVDSEEWNPKKDRMLSAQLRHIKGRYPSELIDFYFIDDCPFLPCEEDGETKPRALFSILKDYFMAQPDCLPKNINLYLIYYSSQYPINLKQDPNKLYNVYLEPKYVLKRTDKGDGTPNVKCNTPANLIDLCEQSKQAVIDSRIQRAEEKLRRIERKKQLQNVVVKKRLKLHSHPFFEYWNELRGDNLAKARLMIQDCMLPSSCCGFFSAKKRGFNRRLQTIVNPSSGMNLQAMVQALDETMQAFPVIGEDLHWCRDILASAHELHVCQETLQRLSV